MYMAYRSVLYERSSAMNPGEGPYSLQRMYLRQDDIWTLPDGSILTITGQTEECFVVGRVIRNNVSKKEQFVPNRRSDGKGIRAERHEGMARLLCHNLNVGPFSLIWERLHQVPLEQRWLLTYAALHYFSSGLDYAVKQTQRASYDVALKYLIFAAPRHETWYTGNCVACKNQEEKVLIRSPQAPAEASLLITFSFKELARLAFPDPAPTERGKRA